VAAKVRIDQRLVDLGLAESRAKAQALVIAGLVYSGTKRLDKPGHSIPADAPLTLKGQGHSWVSRGGLKLAHALEEFGLSPAGRVALDIGASTGGFTDVLLAHDAARVYAVDVGHGQLAWKLRNDDRVVVLEKTNARHLSRDLVADDIGFLTCDASFIGLETVLPAALGLCGARACLVALIKPQFEAGREAVGRGGVVRDESVREAVCERITTWLGSLPDWTVIGLTESPITGPEGNVEYLIAAEKA
jgi:23S rRNA (cytidine1920-2'-O)/16S rRNA (cytidine1409-2'-O)-methyltransferase